MVRENCSDILQQLNDTLTPEHFWTLAKESEEYWKTGKTITCGLFTLLLPVGILGNILVLVVYFLRYQASTTKVFIIAMATFDLLMCISGVPFIFLLLRSDLLTHIRYAECQVLPSIAYCLTISSVLVVLSVAADRYRRMCQEMKKQLTVKQSKFVVAGIVVASFILSIPFPWVYHSEPLHLQNLTVHTCVTDNSNWVTRHYSIVFTVFLVIAFLAITVLYGLMFCKMYKQAQKKRRWGQEQQLEMMSSPAPRPVRRQPQELSPKRFAIMMVFVTYALFVGCFSYIVKGQPTLNLEQLCAGGGYVLSRFLSLAGFFLNSAANPIIYGCFNTIFRRYCRELRIELTRRIKSFCKCEGD